jgi:hypothetical protein
MAYTDPSLIREHVVKLRLNDHEAGLIDAWVNYTGQQKAVLLREMLLEQASLDMGLNAAPAQLANEVPQMGLFKP